MIENIIYLILFTMLFATAIAIVRIDKLFPVVILSGVFSLLSALLFVTLDAVDVAFTEAAVGAGISTVLMLGTIALTRPVDRKPERRSILPLMIVTIVGLTLLCGTLDMPSFGDINAPAQAYLYPEFFSQSPKDIDVPNVVTAILASYRGFDTLGEVAVVFTAGIGVLLLLSGLSLRKDEEGEE